MPGPPSIIRFERAASPRFDSPFGNLGRSSTVDQRSQSKAETCILYSLVSPQPAPPIVLVENRLFKRYTAFLKKWVLADAVGPGLVFRLINGVN
jgi:hypothetical protein